MFLAKPHSQNPGSSLRSAYIRLQPFLSLVRLECTRPRPLSSLGSPCKSLPLDKPPPHYTSSRFGPDSRRPRSPVTGLIYLKINSFPAAAEAPCSIMGSADMSSLKPNPPGGAGGARAVIAGPAPAIFVGPSAFLAFNQQTPNEPNPEIRRSAAALNAPHQTNPIPTSNAPRQTNPIPKSNVPRPPSVHCAKRTQSGSTFPRPAASNCL